MTWGNSYCNYKKLLIPVYYVFVSFLSFAQNPIVTENALAGTPISVWGVPDFRDNRIAGFSTKMSLNRGETVRFKINVPGGANYTLKIYRIGYYGGNGARLKQDLGTFSGTTQPAGISNATTGLLDCSNWSESASWIIPSTAVSGFYIAKLERSGGGTNHIAFIVRNDASNSDLYLQIPDATWQAYNGYGGNSMYDGNTGFPAGHAVKVSYNRPFFPYNSLFNLDGRQADWYMNATYPMIRWLERNGYDVTYTGCNDVANNGGRLLNHKVFISLGHDEYWSKEQKENVEAARNAGVHLAFFSGNEVYWKTRWENNNGTEDRTLVCYKEGTMGDGSLDERVCGNKCDNSSLEWTGLWRTGENYDAGQPENALTGQISWVELPGEIGVPFFYKKLRFWRNTSIPNLSTGQTAFLGVNTLGFEWDYEQPQYASSNPPGRITMSSRTVSNVTHKLSLYRHSSGALVFGAGTVQWSWGLDGNHWGGSTVVSPEMQQATVNLFADMGVQPGTLQGGLSTASQSTDFTAPASTIIAPVNGASFLAGSTTTISGNATDGGGGVVAGVEVSLDGGNTWKVATVSNLDGTVTWSYSWATSSTGTFNIKSRGFDDSGNKENAGAGINVNVGLVDNTPPIVSSVSPVNGAASVSINPTLTANFNETINGSTVTATTFQLKNASNNIIPASVSTSSNQISLTPSVALTGSAVYTVTIKGGASGVKDLAGNALVNDYSWSFTTATSSSTCPCTVFQPGNTPQIPLNNDGQGIVLGMRFRSTQNGFITGIRYYKGTGTTGTHIGHLWTNTGTMLAQATFTSETSSGWQQVLFSSPVAITAGVTYVASYFSPSGDYAITNPYFTQAVVNGPLRALADGEDGTNGLYRYSATSVFPNSSFQSSNYWVDVVFNTSDITAPTVSSVSPANGATGVNTSTTVTANFSEAINGTTVTATTFQLKNAANNIIPASVSTSSNQITLIPSAALTGSAVYTVTIKGGASGVKDLAGNALVNDYTWTFTTVSVDNTPPTVTSVSPVNGTTGVSNTTTVRANFSEAINGSTVTATTFQLKNAANTIIPASVSTSSNQITLIPSSALVNSTTYTVTIKGGASGVKDLAGNALVNDYSWSFTTIVGGGGGGGSITIFQPTNTPAVPLSNDGQGIVLGMKFRSTQNGFITGIRYYKGSGTTGTHSGHLWSNTGGQLAAATFTGETSSGWQQVLFSSQVAITAGVTYIASCFSPSGDYPATELYFTQAVVNSPLRALADGEDGPNGLYNYSATSTFPTNSFNASNYWVDVVFNTSGGGGSLPVVTTQPSAQTKCVGNIVSFNSAASGSPAPTIQWQSSTNGTTWTNISGATNTVLTFGTTITDNNKQYRAVWTNSGGSVNSNPATLTVNALPGAPTVTVVNNCGSSVLTAGSFTGALLWSNGATTSSITVTTAGTYTVTQTLNGCTSAPGSGTAAPVNSSVAAPSVNVINNCGNSVLTATGYTGSLLWSTGATAASITVTTAGTFTVTQTVNECTSAPRSAIAAPKTIPSAPVVTVVNNCGISALTAGAFTGSLLWSNGATTISFTVLTAGTYTVTQTVSGCTSVPGSGTAAPKAIPTIPTLTVVNNCSNSVLTAGAFTGSLLWSNGATTPSITVTTAGTYTVSQTVNGCKTAARSGIAAPKAIPTAPSVAVVNNCGNSVLTAGSFTGSLLWSTGATTSSITVTTAGTYTVTQTVNGCTSAAGSGTAAPVNSSVAAPTVNVINNCGNSVLTATGYTGSLLWSTGATAASITVTTAGTYTVTQTVNECTSAPRSAIAAPKTIPSAPVVTVVNNCGISALTAGAFTGSLLWSNGATTISFTVLTAGTYTVTQTVSGCISVPGSGTAAPKAIPTIPTLTVVNNCSNSVLTAGAFTGSLLWSNGATTPSITVTTAGTYTVSQTVNGCKTAARSGIAAPKAIPTAPSVAVVNNCGNSVLTAGSFTGSLLWSTGATTSSITVTTAGTYTVTQTVNGCTSAAGSGTAAPVNSSVAAPTVNVINNCGNSVLTATGYTGSLLWSTGATAASITVTTAGTYTVTQTVNECTSAPRSAIAAPKTIPSAPVVTVVNNCGISALTAGAFTGSLLWSNGATTISFTVLTAGTYTVTQTVSGCTSVPGSGTAAPKAIPTIPTLTVVNNCSNSVLTAGAFTGSLLWSNGATTPSITVTTAGTYTVSQTVNGCKTAARSGIAAPKAIPTAPSVAVVNNCGNSVLTAGSFTGSLLWSTGATTSSIIVTPAGAYTVTQMVNGCTSAPGSGTAAPANPSVAAPTVNVINNCGNSVLTASGYTGTLLWSTGETTPSISVSAAGTYSVTQTVNGCTSAPGSGTTAPKATPTAPSVTVVDNCGSSLLTAESITGSLLLWSTGATTTPSITVTTAGPYTVTQTVNGCISTAGNGVAAPKIIPSAPAVAVVNNCGNSVLTASGFTGTPLWSNGATTSPITVTIAGIYTVTQSVNGCISAPGNGTAAPLNSNVTAPIVTVVNNCGNSVLTASGHTGTLLWSTGATTTPSITVSAAATYTVTQTVGGCTSAPGSGTAAPKAIPSAPSVAVVDNCGSSLLTAAPVSGTLLWSNGATTTPSITVTTAGPYTVTQTVNGCISTAGNGVAAPKIIPSAPAVAVVNNCGNSVLTASGFTGTPLWSNGATTSPITVTIAGIYMVTYTENGCTSVAGSGTAAPLNSNVTAPIVTVVNNCGNSVLTASGYTGTLLWSTGETTPSISVSAAGTYSVTQTVNGCTSAPGSGTTAPKATPTAPSVTVVDNCGSSLLTAESITGSLLLWSTGATTTPSITVTTAGPYTVTQTVNGCISTAGNGVAAPKIIPSAPAVAVVNNCGNSVLTASGFTGTPLWSNGATTSPITVTIAGIYMVTYTENGCTSVAGSGTAAPLNSNVTAPIVTVVNNCGNSVLTASGHTGTLLWSTGETTTPSITVSTAATYTVTQTVGGCTSAPGSGTAAPKAIPTAPSVTVVDNCGSSLLTAAPVSGTLLWSNGATTTPSITVTTAGPYTVTQTVNGCISTAGNGVAAPKIIPSAPAVAVVNNCGNSVLTASGFTGTPLWSNGATTSPITVTIAGIYMVTYTENGCTSVAGSGTAAPLNSNVTAPIVTVVNNCGNSVLTASGHTGTLLWSTGETTTPSITVSTAGPYTVTQTIDGCASAPASGTAAPNTIPSAPAVAVVDNCGNSVLTAESITGSLLLWSTGATTTPSITVTTAATYTVTQTVNGCTSAAGNGVATPKIIPSAPAVAVVNNCGHSVLTASDFTGTPTWSNGATTSPITVTIAGIYTVTYTENGCTSVAGSGTAAPLNSNVTAPIVTVVNNCGNSVLTASGHTGTLLWSTGETTTPSITVSTAGPYTVTQTIDGCTSAEGSGVTAPKIIPALSSNLAATATSGTAFTYTPASTTSGTTFEWSRAAISGISNAAANGTGNIVETLVNTTSSPVNVTYVYSLTADGCTNTQNVILIVNPEQPVNCVINGSITSSFNSTAIPAGRYIWFNSVFDRGSFTGVTGPVTYTVSNSRISFTANSQQYILNVPDARIIFDAAVTSASTQFINNVWETAVPRTYTGYAFMSGLSYLVPANLPGDISNIVWTADISIDKTGITVSWQWTAAVYTSFADHAGLNVKPINGSTQNPYPNSDKAGTPDNFKAFVVPGAKGTGETNYTGTYSGTSTVTCATTTGQRSSGPPIQEQFNRQPAKVSVEQFQAGELDVTIMPNPTSNFFNLVIKGNSNGPISIRVLDVFGQVLEKHKKVVSGNVLILGQKWTNGTYFAEVIQGDQRKVVKIIKAN